MSAMPPCLSAQAAAVPHTTRPRAHGLVPCDAGGAHVSSCAPPRRPPSLLVARPSAHPARADCGSWQSETVLLPDKFAGGIIGAFLAALIGALISGYALPAPGLPTENPPGLSEAIWALPGSLLGLAGSYVWGSRQRIGE